MDETTALPEEIPTLPDEIPIHTYTEEEGIEAKIEATVKDEAGARGRGGTSEEKSGKQAPDTCGDSDEGGGELDVGQDNATPGGDPNTDRGLLGRGPHNGTHGGNPNKSSIHGSALDDWKPYEDLSE